MRGAIRLMLWMKYYVKETHSGRNDNVTNERTQITVCLFLFFCCWAEAVLVFRILKIFLPVLFLNF